VTEFTIAFIAFLAGGALGVLAMGLVGGRGQDEAFRSGYRAAKHEYQIYANGDAEPFWTERPEMRRTGDE